VGSFRNHIPKRLSSSQTSFQKLKQIILPNRNTLSENQMAGRDIAGIAGWRKRRVDDRLLGLARRLGIAVSAHRAAQPGKMENEELL
jgi:hypothetical protein